MGNNKYKVNIFEALKKMNKGKFEWFENLTEEEEKSLSPYVMLLFTKGAQQNHYAHIVLNNEYVNSFVFRLDQNHRQLLYKLLCAANHIGDDAYYKFQKKDRQNLNVKAISWYYNINKYKAQEIEPLFTEEAIEDIKELYEQSIQ